MRLGQTTIIEFDGSVIQNRSAKYFLQIGDVKIALSETQFQGILRTLQPTTSNTSPEEDYGAYIDAIDAIDNE